MATAEEIGARQLVLFSGFDRQSHAAKKCVATVWRNSGHEDTILEKEMV